MTKPKYVEETRRINANIPLKLANRVEKYANENMLNLTSAYITLLNSALNSYEMMKAMPLYTQFLQNPKFINSLKSTSNIDNEEVVKFNDFLSKLTPEQIDEMINNNSKED